MSTSPFLDLLSDPMDIKAVVNSITDAVAVSYVSHPMRKQTDREDRRRTQICLRLFRLMRGDVRWPVRRCVDTMAEALQVELSGKKWTPDPRSSWFTTEPVGC